MTEINNLNNIIMHAWNKDAVNLKSVIDAEMNSRVEAAINTKTADVAASMFAATVGDEYEELEDDSEPVEGQSDENIQ